jgi:hypothetical protein
MIIADKPDPAGSVGVLTIGGRVAVGVGTVVGEFGSGLKRAGEGPALAVLCDGAVGSTVARGAWTSSVVGVVTVAEGDCAAVDCPGAVVPFPFADDAWEEPPSCRCIMSSNELDDSPWDGALESSLRDEDTGRESGPGEEELEDVLILIGGRGGNSGQFGGRRGRVLGSCRSGIRRRG